MHGYPKFHFPESRNKQVPCFYFCSALAKESDKEEATEESKIEKGRKRCIWKVIVELIAIWTIDRRVVMLR